MHGYGSVDQLRYGDVPVPAAGPGGVLVKVAATSVNPIDWKIRRGNLKGMLTLQFPVIPGRDVAGEVVAAGAAVVSAREHTPARPFGFLRREHPGGRWGAILSGHP
jgi:NADPH:quinone reductase-like Zn-dependent oxidoreductase